MHTKKKLEYWVPTGLLAALIFISGAFNVTLQPNVVRSLEHLGFPGYLGTLLGIYKLLAAVTLVFGSRWPRLRGWAFAGLFFNLSGAIVAHSAMGDGFAGSAPAGVLLGLTGITYAAQRRFARHQLADTSPLPNALRPPAPPAGLYSSLISASTNWASSVKDSCQPR